MSIKIITYATLILFLFTFNGFAADQVKIKNRIRIKNILKTEMKLQQKTVEKLMLQLKKQLKTMKQNQLYIGEETVKQLARICKQYRLNIQDTAKIIATGSLYTYQMKNYGIEKKQLRRQLSMSVIKELSNFAKNSDTSGKVIKSLQKRLRLQIQKRLFAGEGHKGNNHNYCKQNQNKNAHSYYGERSNSGSAKKKKSASNKSGK